MKSWSISLQIYVWLGKPITKLRVVFDASYETSTGLSLNDVTLKGYQVQPDLFETVQKSED